MADESYGSDYRSRHGYYEPRSLKRERVQRSLFADPGSFGRMFPTLPRLDVSDDVLEKLAEKIQTDSDEEQEDNERILAGFTFFGQFVDHDITFDPTSSLEQQNDPEAIRNFRTPLLELDSLYGAGPAAEPYLYDQDNDAKLLIGQDETGEANDLPRNRQGVALIGDPRNDENLIVSQLHLAFLKFHNAVVDHIVDNGIEKGRKIPLGEEVLFREAQRIVRWHYQWIVAHEFLELICGEGIVQEIVEADAGGLIGQDPVGNVLDRHLRHFRFKELPFIPVEFAVAAYRFGHSQVRAGYSINANFASGLFPQGSADPAFAGRTLFVRANLTDDKVLKKDRVVDWVRFNDVPGFPPSDGFPQHGMKIDGRLSPSLFNLPGVPAGLESLALRNLKRSSRFELPWGERVALAMRVDPLDPDEVGITDLGFSAGRTPLWYYILKEAELRAGGQHLGPVGARIVAEVLLGLLLGDPLSYLSQDPYWRPFLPAGTEDDFRLGDLFNVAGVPTVPAAPAAPTPPTA